MRAAGHIRRTVTCNVVIAFLPLSFVKQLWCKNSPDMITGRRPFLLLHLRMPSNDQPIFPRDLKLPFNDYVRLSDQVSQWNRIECNRGECEDQHSDERIFLATPHICPGLIFKWTARFAAYLVS